MKNVEKMIRSCYTQPEKIFISTHETHTMFDIDISQSNIPVPTMHTPSISAHPPPPIISHEFIRIPSALVR